MSKYIDADKLIAEIKKLKNGLISLMNKVYYAANYKEWEAELNGYNKIVSIIHSLQDNMCDTWIKVDEDHPLPYKQEVIGYNKEWVNEDFNPSGTRIGFFSDTGFFSAKWVNDQYCYVTCFEEGDDYETFQIQPDGTRKTWCKYEHGEAVEGYLPNMPTHYMLIPTTPDGFAWPSEK